MLSSSPEMGATTKWMLLSEVADSSMTAKGRGSAVGCHQQADGHLTLTRAVSVLRLWRKPDWTMLAAPPTASHTPQQQRVVWNQGNKLTLARSCFVLFVFLIPTIWVCQNQYFYNEKNPFEMNNPQMCWTFRVLTDTGGCRALVTLALVHSTIWFEGCLGSFISMVIHEEHSSSD